MAIKVKKFKNSDVLSSYVLTIFDDFSTFRTGQCETDWNLNIDQWNGYFKVALKVGEGNDWRSTVVVNATKRKCRSAQSILRTTLFPSGNIPMKLEHTPVIEGPWAVLLPKAELERRTAAQAQVYKDWAAEGDIESEFDKYSFDLVVHGTAAWRARKFKKIQHEAFVPSKATHSKQEIADNPQNPLEGLRYKLEVTEKYIPTGEHIDIWDVFLDPEADDSQGGVGVIHRPQIRPDELLSMVADDEDDFYDEDAVEAVMASVKSRGKHGSKTGMKNPVKDENGIRRETIDIYDFWGVVPIYKLLEKDEEKWRSIFEENKMKIDEDNKHASIEVNIVVADHRTIAVKINKAGSRPIYVSTWLKQNGTPYGIGIPLCMRDMQTIQNGLARSYMDAKMFEGVPYGAVKRQLLMHNQTTDIWPGKMFELQDEVDSIKDVIHFDSISGSSYSLTDGMAWSSKESDDDSGIPKLLEGQVLNVEKTRYEVEQSMSGAHAFILYIMKKLDQNLFVPQWREYYKFLMITEEYIPIQADMNVKAWGYESYSRKVTKMNALMFILQTISNMKNQEISIETNYKKIMSDIYESQNLNPADYTFTIEEVEAKQKKLMDMQAQAQAQADQQVRQQEEQKDFQKTVQNLPEGMQANIAAGREQGLIQ